MKTCSRCGRKSPGQGADEGFVQRSQCQPRKEQQEQKGAPPAVWSVICEREAWLWSWCSYYGRKDAYPTEVKFSCFWVFAVSAKCLRTIESSQWFVCLPMPSPSPAVSPGVLAFPANSFSLLFSNSPQNMTPPPHTHTHSLHLQKSPSVVPTNSSLGKCKLLCFFFWKKKIYALFLI